MLGRHLRSGRYLFLLRASATEKGQERPGTMPRHEFSERALSELLRALRARTFVHPDNPGLNPQRQPRQNPRRLGDRSHDRGASVPSVIVVAETATDERNAFNHDRRAFQLKERMTSSDMRDPHVAAQLIERIGWALADAEDAERAASSS